jgi:membrane protein required for colicin V production
MPWLDILLAIPIIWGMYRGFKRGFIIEICTLMALALGIYGASLFGERAGGYLHEAFNTNEELSFVIAFTLVFLAILIVVFLFGKMLEGAIKMVALSPINKILGLIFGGFKFALIVSGLFFVIHGFWPQKSIIPDSWKKDSYLYKPLVSLVPSIYPKLEHKGWQDEIKEKLETATEKVVMLP